MADPVTATMALMAGGTALQGYGQLRAGRKAKEAADFEASQLEQKAGQTLATSQRAALEEERQGRLQQSRALAIAAASGGGASDPTVVNLMGNLAAETNYRKMVALYEGKTEAEQLRTQADITRAGGREAKKASQIQALGTILSGGSSMYSKFGMKQ